MTLAAPSRADDQVVRPTTLTDGETRFYRREGYLPIPGVLPSGMAEALRAEVMEIMTVIGGFEQNKLRQTPEYLEGSAVDRFVHCPGLRSLAEQLLGGPATLYLPFTAVKGSGGGAFHFHQDNNYTRYVDGLLGINLWFALSEMTPENGCLMIVPRSHAAGQQESEDAGEGDAHRKVRVDPSDFLPLRMRAGDCVAFSRLTVHGSGANTTPTPRVGYAVQFFRNDAYFYDKATGERRSLLSDSPMRQYARPVRELTPPKAKTDGH